MRLATYNVENMFDRAKALNMPTWADGRPALEAHAALKWPLMPQLLELRVKVPS